MRVSTSKAMLDISPLGEESGGPYGFVVHGTIDGASLVNAAQFLRMLPTAMQAAVMTMELQNGTATQQFPEQQQLPIQKVKEEPPTPEFYRRGTFVMTKFGWVGLVREDVLGAVEVYRLSQDDVDTVDRRYITASAKIVMEGDDTLGPIMDLADGKIGSWTELWKLAMEHGIRTGNTWTLSPDVFESDAAADEEEPPGSSIMDALAAGQEVLEAATRDTAATVEEARLWRTGNRVDQKAAITSYQERNEDASVREAKEAIQLAIEKIIFDEAVEAEREKIRRDKAACPPKDKPSFDSSAGFIGMIVTLEEPGERPSAFEVTGEDDEEVEVIDLDTEKARLVSRKYIRKADDLNASKELLEDYIDRSNRHGKKATWTNIVAAVRAAEAAKVATVDDEGAIVVDEDIIDSALDIGRKQKS